MKKRMCAFLLAALAAGALALTGCAGDKQLSQQDIDAIKAAYASRLEDPETPVSVEVIGIYSQGAIVWVSGEGEMFTQVLTRIEVAGAVYTVPTGQLPLFFRQGALMTIPTAFENGYLTAQEIQSAGAVFSVDTPAVK